MSATLGKASTLGAHRPTCDSGSSAKLNLRYVAPVRGSFVQLRGSFLTKPRRSNLPVSLQISATSTSDKDSTSYVYDLATEQEKQEARILKLAAITDRGRSAEASQRNLTLSAISELEALGAGSGPADSSGSRLVGTWRLVYASESATRSSPFFWAWRKALDGIEQPLPGLKPSIAESIFQITDGIPFAEIGQAIQTVGADGKLVSQVQVSLRIFDAILPPQVGMMTTTSSWQAMGSGTVQLTVETTEVKDSTWASYPGLSAVDDFKFPSKEMLEQMKEGSATVTMEVTYLSDTMRIIRNESGNTFVFVRLDK